MRVDQDKPFYWQSLLLLLSHRNKLKQTTTEERIFSDVGLQCMRGNGFIYYPQELVLCVIKQMLSYM